MTRSWQDLLPKPVAFVFSGGSALGAIQIGMLKALVEHNLHPNLVVGTSAGSLNGAVIADFGLEEGTARLDTVWRNVVREDVFPGGAISQMRHFLSTRNSLFSNDKLAEFVCGALKSARFEELSLPFGALATDLLTNHGALFQSGMLRPALLASASIPGIYPPVDIQGKLYVDGGLTANVPLKSAVQMGAASLVVLDAGEICHRQEAPKNIASMFVASLNAVMRQRVRVEAPALANHVPILYLPTPCPVAPGLTNFSQSVALMEQAYEMAAAFLKEAPVPAIGNMSGAPHFHDDAPISGTTHMGMASAD